MTQLELPFAPGLTLSAFVEMNAWYEANTGARPSVCRIPRKDFDQLMADLPPGSLVAVGRAPGSPRMLPTLDGVAIEVIEEPGQFVVSINRAPAPRQPDYWDTGARIS